MKINSYKLKENATINDLLKDGLNYSVDCKYLSKWIVLKGNIMIWIKVRLTDSSLIVEVIDDSFGQYYIPFYDYKSNKIELFDFLDKIIEKYNYEMDQIKSFELVS